MKNLKNLMHELKHHAPFTALATLIAIVVVLIFNFLLNKNLSKELFGISHPLHIFFSAIVSAGIFYKYKKNILYALLVGVLGAIIAGTLSDVIFPYFGGRLLNFNPAFHFPLIENPILILMSAIAGGLAGILIRTTKIPHLFHVFLSAFASLFYLLAFSEIIGFVYFAKVFLIVFFSVIIPCCIGDIVFPFLFLGKRIKTCDC